MFSKKLVHYNAKNTLIFLLLIFITVIVIFTLSLFLILSLLLTNFLSRLSSQRNNIILPKEKSLYDLYEFTYRHGSLYRSNRDLLISKNNNIDVSLVRKNAIDDNEITVLKVHEHVNNNINFEVKCSVSCNCYNNDFLNYDERRAVFSNLVYSYRYTSIVVVSLVGYAFSRFVNEHIDDCYDRARGVIGQESPITCLFEVEEGERGCDMNDVKIKDEKNPWTIDFECTGHCVDQEFEKVTNLVKRAWKDENCDDKWGEPEIFKVFSVFSSPIVWEEQAKSEYMQLDLMPFCESIIYGTRKKIRPCCGYVGNLNCSPKMMFLTEEKDELSGFCFDHKMDNVKCKQLGEARRLYDYLDD